MENEKSDLKTKKRASKYYAVTCVGVDFHAILEAQNKKELRSQIENLSLKLAEEGSSLIVTAIIKGIDIQFKEKTTVEF